MAPPAALIVVGAFTVAAVTVRDIGDTPQVPRDAAELRCAGTAPQVCLWPERPDELGAIAAIARDVHDRLSAIGLEVPSEASESVTAAWSFVMPRDGDPVTTRSALARGLAPHVPECLPGQPPRDRLPWQAGSVSSSAMAVPYLQAWLEIQAGVPPEAVTVRYPASVTGYLAQALAEPIDEQLADYERAVVAVRTCAPITVATAS